MFFKTKLQLCINRSLNYRRILIHLSCCYALKCNVYSFLVSIFSLKWSIGIITIWGNPWGAFAIMQCYFTMSKVLGHCLASLREIVGGNLTYMRFFSSIIFLLLMHNYLIRHLKFFRNALWSLYIIVIILLDTKPTPTLHWKMKKNRYCSKSGIFVWVLAWFYLVNVKLITKSWAVYYLSQHTAYS